MKYQGGKYFMGKYIADILLEMAKGRNIDGYIEPFCGALGVMRRMTTHFEKCYAYDIHEDLILLWNEVKDNTLIPPNLVVKNIIIL